jgi:hypothetical protein
MFAHPVTLFFYNKPWPEGPEKRKSHDYPSTTRRRRYPLLAFFIEHLKDIVEHNGKSEQQSPKPSELAD